MNRQPSHFTRSNRASYAKVHLYLPGRVWLPAQTKSPSSAPTKNGQIESSASQPEVVMPSEIVSRELPEDYLVNLGLEASFQIAQIRAGAKKQVDALDELIVIESRLRLGSDGGNYG